MALLRGGIRWKNWFFTLPFILPDIIVNDNEIDVYYNLSDVHLLVIHHELLSRELSNPIRISPNLDIPHKVEFGGFVPIFLIYRSLSHSFVHSGPP